ncbi:MAG: chemotaxis protein CheA [bacterium]
MSAMDREDKYAEAFREEAAELLSDLEEVILSLENNPKDQELINRLFRVMHTIKGSGAMFGFQKIADFAHHLETMLDLVRTGTLSITAELSDLLLRSRDQIQIMLCAQESESEESADEVNRILAGLKKLQDQLSPAKPFDHAKPGDRGKSTGSAKPVDSAKSGDSVKSGDSARSGEGSLLELLSQEKNQEQEQCFPKEQRAPFEQCNDQQQRTPSSLQQATYRLRIKLNQKVMASGLDPLCLLKDLRSIGECAISAQTDQVPWLDEMDPEACYFYWDAIISTSASREEIEGIFLFVQDESQISITKLSDECADEEEQKKIGEILVERGDITKEQVRKILSRQKRAGELMVEAGIVSRGKVESALIEQKMVRQLRDNQLGNDTIRVSTKKLDRLINLVGEMVITQAQLSQTSAHYQDTDILAPVENIERLTNELRDCALNIRMLPIETTFGKFRRLVHDLSASLGKEAELVTEGGETELDKTVIERMHDPLVHLIRNSIDHGLESPDGRKKAGKPACGTIRLSAGQSGGEVIISIQDDGAGLCRERILAKGIEQGLVSESDNLTDSQIFNLIFMPGFSTASKVTDVSGRGVGMDVVRREISKLRGSVDIKSQQGKGTTTSIHLPLTLAIIEGLLVAVESSHYVIPLTFVQECVELTSREVINAHGRHVINLRGELIPYIRLREIFSLDDDSSMTAAPAASGKGTRPSIEYVVVAMVEGKRIGLVTDTIIGDYQAVIKSLGKVYEHTEGLSGATILGDGTIALIVDVRQLIECAHRQEKEMLVCA